MISGSNRLGGKLSKEKQRPKSTERLKTLKPKSTIDITEQSPLAEDAEPFLSTNDSSRDDFKEFRINRDQMKSKYFPKPPVKARTCIRVRKVDPLHETEKIKTRKKVLVARPVPEDDIRNYPELQPFNLIDSTSDALLKSSNILGSAEGFQEQVSNNGRQFTLQPMEEDISSVAQTRVVTPYSSNKNIFIDETNALKNWQHHMNARKKQQEHLSKHLKVVKDMLVMNQSDNFRSVQEERTIIDRAMPTKDYGKGYRVGSEFWKQVEVIGNDSGVSVTLNQTEKGLVPPIEHIGHPLHVKKEMGTDWTETSQMRDVHFALMKSSYLYERKKHLKDVIHEMDPHKPYLDRLEVIGKLLMIPSKSVSSSNMETGEDNLESSDDETVEEQTSEQPITPSQVYAPSLIINGQSTSWQGDTRTQSCENVGLTVRLLFETEIASISKNSLNITNDGTTAVYYQWKRKQKKGAFDLEKTHPIMRFYFDIDDGLIYPGVTTNIPFFFKSPNTGIFTETWQLCTQPVLCDGAKIEVVLRGVTNERDVFQTKQKEMNRILQEKQNKRMVERLLADVLTGIQTPPRPGTPTNAYVTEEAIFNTKNEKMTYKTNIVNTMKKVYEDLNDGNLWDLSVTTLLKNILNIAEEEEKEVALQTLNSNVSEMNWQTQIPVDRNYYDLCYQIFCESVDKFVLNSRKLRTDMGLPEKEFVIKSDGSTLKKGSNLEIPKHPRVDSTANKKDTPSARNRTPKEKKVGGSSTNVVEVAADEDGVLYEGVSNELNGPVYVKYIELLHMQAYNCLCEMVDAFDVVLSGN